LLIAAIAAGAVALIAGAVAIGAPDRTPAPSEASHRLAAEMRAAQLMREVPLPTGVEEVGSDESALSLLSGPEASLQRTPQLVAIHRFWRVPGEPQTAIAWIERHPPAGSSLIERGSGGRRGSTTTWGATFSFPAARSVLLTVWLTVLVADAKGGGTAMRADAQVEWTRPRPSSERIPADASLVTVTVKDRRHRVSFVENVKARAAVEAIVALIEGLQRPGESTSSCPADSGNDPTIELAFRTTPGAPPLVRVHIDDNGCGSVSFWRGAREQPLLGEASEATQKLQKLLARRL
jgi:hypothetical protein